MSERGGQRITAEVVGVAVVLATTVVPFLWWRRRRRAAVCPDISIPEALHVLSHGSFSKRVLAARGLVGILNGEVQVLEELLDEASNVHPEYGGGRRNDGRCLLRVVLDDLSSEVRALDAEAFADLLLQCTAFDVEWDETDEWNEMTQRAVGSLRAVEGADALLAKAEVRHAGSPIAEKASVLRRRLSGDRAAAVTVVPGTTELPRPAPGVLSMNTRVQCAVCFQMGSDLMRCPQCQNVGYCSHGHLGEDLARHAAWCFPGGSVSGTSGSTSSS
eukprot:TRINITY_DN57658_c0_g1_i1.p1 TRINITY_DN57658_c0_g1~~TRINITY_DN57658_c0_g1_i1.p1  ORF type:complete len:274 (-),score=55.45 TRINITY_DN57658_c0_g1_i1:36-857(-)